MDRRRRFHDAPCSTLLFFGVKGFLGEMENINKDSLQVFLDKVNDLIHSDKPIEQRKKEALNLADQAMPAYEEFVKERKILHPELFD